MTFCVPPLATIPINTLYPGITFEVSAVLETTWTVLNHVSVPLDVTWNTSQYVMPTLDVTWDTYAYVFKDVVTTWDIKQYALSPLNVYWSTAYLRQLSPPSNAYCIKPVKRVVSVPCPTTECDCD